MYNRPRHFNHVDKLQLVIDGNDATRYHDDRYVQHLRTGQIIYKDETEETTIRFITVTTPSASHTEMETTWNIVRTTSLKMTPKSEISKIQKTKNLTKRKLSVYKSKAPKTFPTPSQPKK